MSRYYIYCSSIHTLHCWDLFRTKRLTNRLSPSPPITSSAMTLPRRQWVAKFTPDTLETYLSDPDPLGQLRQTHTVWSDDFDNIIDPTISDDAPGLSRAQLCRLRNNEAVFNHRGHPHGRPSLLQGFRPSHLLFTDDCFLDGLLQGIGLILVIASMLAAAVGFGILIRRRMRSWKAEDARMSRPSGSGAAFGGTGEKTKGMEFVEAV